MQIAARQVVDQTGKQFAESPNYNQYECQIFCLNFDRQVVDQTGKQFAESPNYNQYECRIFLKVIASVGDVSWASSILVSDPQKIRYPLLNMWDSQLNSFPL